MQRFFCSNPFASTIIPLQHSFSFCSQKPMVFPTGFSGDIGKGSQTAYDVLPPKKWTNPDKK
jgi:hypothetical protein